MDYMTDLDPESGLYFFITTNPSDFQSVIFPKEETLYTIDYCLASSSSLHATFQRWSLGGICCENGEGYFRVYMNGDLVGEAPEGFFNQCIVMYANGSINMQCST